MSDDYNFDSSIFGLVAAIYLLCVDMRKSNCQNWSKLSAVTIICQFDDIFDREDFYSKSNHNLLSFQNFDQFSVEIPVGAKIGIL